MTKHDFIEEGYSVDRYLLDLIEDSLDYPNNDIETRAMVEDFFVNLEEIDKEDFEKFIKQQKKKKNE